MYKSKKIAVVIPCYNVEKQISKVIKTIPKFVDKIVLVDDKSKDKTPKIIKIFARSDKRIIFIQHYINEGVGGAVATGFNWCKKNNIDIASVMDGDGQMLPDDLSLILDPVADNKADFSKANRLLSGNAYQAIPKVRFFGNSTLSFLTKIASGYWHVMDSQAGFKAINKKMLKFIDWNSMYKRYGYSNDLLVRLNVYNAKVTDILLEPVYGVGEKSSMKMTKVICTIPKMLFKMFLWRLKEKYIIRDFHPLVLFYFFGFLSGFFAILLMFRWLYLWPVIGEIPKTTFLAWMLCVITSIQFISFAMWFDMEYNKELKV